LLAELSRHGLRWQVVEVRRARPQAAAIAAVERPGQSMRLDGQSAALAGPAAARTARSLDALKEFALGE
jgi:hypothetical protein